MRHRKWKHLKLSQLKTVIDITNPSKVSNAFLRFIDPLLTDVLAEFDKSPTSEELDKISRIPWMAWNCEVLETNNCEENFIKIFKQQVKDIPQAIELFEKYRKRKRSKFKKYNVMLSEVTFIPSNSGYYNVIVKCPSGKHV